MRAWRLACWRAGRAANVSRATCRTEWGSTATDRAAVIADRHDAADAGRSRRRPRRTDRCQARLLGADPIPNGLALAASRRLYPTAAWPLGWPGRLGTEHGRRRSR